MPPLNRERASLVGGGKREAVERQGCDRPKGVRGSVLARRRKKFRLRRSGYVTSATHSLAFWAPSRDLHGAGKPHPHPAPHSANGANYTPIYGRKERNPQCRKLNLIGGSMARNIDIEGGGRESPREKLLLSCSGPLHLSLRHASGFKLLASGSGSGPHPCRPSSGPPGRASARSCSGGCRRGGRSRRTARPAPASTAPAGG